MLEHESEERLLGEREVTSILRRAAELQAKESSSAAASEPGGGITISQLEQAAGELGISPSLVREAARELTEGPRTGSKPSFWGGPSITDLLESVPGQVDEESWPLVLDIIRTATGRVGATAQQGRAYEWTSTAPDVCHVAVTPVRGQVRLRVLSRCGEWGGLIYMGLFLLALILSAVLAGSLHPSVPLGFAMAAGCFSGSYLAGRTMFNRLCAGRRRHAREVMRRLREHFHTLPDPGTDQT